MHAARNTVLCTKDCLCLFVCPTGATDTETGQIDFNRCLDGCRLCVDACPSHALYLVMDKYAEPRLKDPRVVGELDRLLVSKVAQESISRQVDTPEQSPIGKLLAKALASSNRIMAEDCCREAGFMLPQSGLVKEFLASLLETGPDTDNGFPAGDIQRLLRLL
ncbi:MAG: 4Fe-4S ferredoxin [Sphaerochaetaceae bacterium]